MMPLVDSILLKSACLIDGHWRSDTTDRWLVVDNPANGQIVGKVPDFGEKETIEAIEAAERAGVDWKSRTASARAEILQSWYRLIVENRTGLASILTVEQGKPLRESLSEIDYAASFVQWFAEEGKRVYGELIPSPASDRRILVYKQPVGVCAAITPWNFPAAMVTRKIAPALAAGCTMILKPAEQTPLTALALAELAQQAGFPPGVLNVITGDPIAIGRALTSHTTVRKLSFTGSTEVGQLLMAQCAPTLKRLSLELGGNAPFLVFEDADLDEAVHGFMAAKFRNAGQTCICANRLLVQSTIYDRFEAHLMSAIENLRVGNGMEPEVDQGPLIDQAAVQKVERLLEDAKAQGAAIACGGHRHPKGSNWFKPTLVKNVRNEMAIAQEEIFGPVVAMIPFDTEQEALRLANDTRYGLAAYFYTRDLGRMFRVAEGLEFGMVATNTGSLSTEVAPFGGIKHSGFGREGSHFGIDEYLQLKYHVVSGMAASSLADG